MQQLKQRQIQTAQTASPNGTQARKFPTKIETISSSGSVKLALKSKISGHDPQRAANVVPSTQPAATPQPVPEQSAPTSTGGDFGGHARGDFGGRFAWADLLSDDRFAKPLLAAAAVAGILILGATTLALLPNTQEPVAAAVIPEAATPVAPSDNLARLMQVAAIETPEPNTVAAPVTAAPVAATPAFEASGDLMSKMTAETLAALRTPAPVAPPAVASGQSNVSGRPIVGGSDLYQLVMTAHAQGQSATYIDRLLNDAYLRGQISVPRGLVRADGRVDTDTILSLFIQ